jgi:hypothetical protein
MTMKKTIIAMTLLGTAASARADERVLDLADTFVSLGEVRNETDKGVDSRYIIRVNGLVAGAIDTADRVKIEWKANGKVALAFECDVQGSDGQAPFECRTDESKALDLYGDVQAVFSYVDDSEDAVTPLYTMNLKVARFWGWYQRGKKVMHFPKYQIDHSDLLGSAIVWHRPFEEPSTLGAIELYTTGVVGSDGGGEWGTETMRCTAAGTKLADVRAGVGNMQLAEATDWRGPDKPTHAVKWQRMVTMPTGFRWGTTAKLSDDERRQYDAKEIVVLGDHPGDWSCDLRRKGQVLRTFSFKVGTDGRIAPHAEQTAGLRLLSSESMVTVSFPDEAWDGYFDPARMKSTGWFGRPWSSAPPTKLAKPKGPLELPAPKGAKGGTLAKKPGK